MPSIHAADALIVGITMALIVKSRWVKALWLAWPAWVWFSVMATANHFWLDIAAGVLVALVAGAIVYRRRLRGLLRRPRLSGRERTESRARRQAGRTGRRARPRQAGVHEGGREILARSMRGVAKTKLTPDMLTLAGVTLCLAGAVLVGFEERNEHLFFWLGGVLFVIGSIADILDGALARAASKGTVFGAFLDSSFDRVGEAAMLAAIGLTFMRDGNEVALGPRSRPSSARFSSATRARRRSRSACERTSASVARRARRAHLDRPRARAVGAAPVADLRTGGDRLADRCPAHPLRAPPARRARGPGLGPVTAIDGERDRGSGQRTLAGDDRHAPCARGRPWSPATCAVRLGRGALEAPGSAGQARA